MTTLEITFHGQIALVANLEKTAMRMLIGRFSLGDKTPTAYIRFDKDCLPAAPTRGTPDGPPATADAAFQNLRHYVLDGELLSIRTPVASSSSTLRLNESKDPVAKTPIKGVDDLSLYWLPHIERLSPGAGDVEPALLEIPLKAKPGLAARIDLKDGLLQTTGPEKFKVDFERKDGTRVETAIARECRLTLDFEGDHVVFESTPLDGARSDPSRAIRLNADGASRIAVTIGNEPAIDIYEPVPQVTDELTIAEEVRKEFALYYTLVKSPPEDPPLPRVRIRRPNGHLCGQGRLNDSAGPIG